MFIKENCWKWPTKQGFQFVKIYDDVRIAKKVKAVHTALSRIHFPYALPLIASEPHVIRQQWREGRAFSFAKSQERVEAMRMMNALHETKSAVDWRTAAVLPTFFLYKKWAARLERFQQYEPLLRPKIGTTVYDAINEWATRSFRTLSPSQQVNLTLLHGDVAHHNFLALTSGDNVLIDFDLACYGDAKEELILLWQRMLPHVDYDSSQLFDEMPIDFGEKRAYLAFPNELLREALYLIQLNEQQEAHFEQFFLPYAQQALQHADRLMLQVCE